MKKSPTKIKKEKAFAVYDKKGGFILATATKEMALLEIENGEKYRLYNRKVIPCEITYKL